MQRNQYTSKIYNTIGALLSVLLFINVAAQGVRVNLVVSARPSSYLSEWYRPQNGTVVLTATNGAILDLKYLRFETELMNSEGQAIYKLPYLQSEVLPVTGNAATFSLSQILQLQNGNFIRSKLTNSFSEGGKLAEGQYSIRVRVWDGQKEAVQSEWTPSKMFLINSYQLPQLMQPADGKELDAHLANSAVIFRWTPLAPALPQAATTYRIQIWQVLQGQTPMQTLRSMPPLEDRLIKGTTQFVWQPRLNMIAPEPAATNQFIWTIQTLDEKEMPIATTDASAQGMSQPFVFSFSNKSIAADSSAAGKNKNL